MTSRNRARQRQDSGHSYARLERRLTLLSWLHGQLGYADTKRLLDDIVPAKRRIRRGRAQLRLRTASAPDRSEGSPRQTWNATTTTYESTWPP